MPIPLLTKKKAIQLGLETAFGTEQSTLIDALAFDFEIMSEAEWLERKGTGTSVGFTSPGVPGDALGVASFMLEMRGNGTTALDTALEAALQASGFKLTGAVFSPFATVADQKTLTIASFEDGVKKVLTGAMGEVSFVLEGSNIVACKFEFKGMYSTPTDVAMPAGYAPGTTLPMKGGQTATFSLGGVDRNINKLELKMDNQLAYRGNHYIITDRSPIVSIDPESTKVADHDWYGLYRAGTTAALSQAVTDGTQIVTIAVPAVQYKELKGGDRDGIAIYELTGQCNTDSVAGNDEVTLTVS